MSLFDWFARRSDQTAPVACAEGFQQYTCRPFWLATGGRATMVSTIPGPFTDDPPAANVTAIRATHIVELRTRADLVRQRYGLMPYGYADPTLAAGAASIRAQHIVDLRNALAEAYTAAGLVLPSYSDPSLAAGVPVRAVHLRQLRAALAQIE